jgi:hypothetical protein
MKVGGIELPEKINVNKVALQLNGAAPRTKFFIQTYVIALYAAQKITDERTAIESDIERCLRMQITTPLATPATVSQSIIDGLKHASSGYFSAHKDIIEDIRHIIENSKVQYKDHIDIYRTANGGLKLFKNDKEIYFHKTGKHFAELLFDMYLGKHPKDSKIKKALLKG